MKIKNKITFISILLLLVFTTSCDIVDSLKTYPINIPYSHTFSVSGSNTSIVEEQEFCISNDSTYQDYKDKVKKVTFVEVALRVTDYSPANLRGDITVYLNDSNGNTLFTESISNGNPEDYKTTPYIISLEETEIQAIDSYLETALENNEQLCFTSGITLNITSGGNTNSIAGAVDLVFEIATEL